MNSLATQRAYSSDWRDFQTWCGRFGLDPSRATPRTVGSYLASLATGLRQATLKRRVAAISAMHRRAGHTLDRTHPAIAEVLGDATLAESGYSFGRRAKVASLSFADLQKTVRALPTTLAGVRDSAILLIGFAGALHRSELSALNFDEARTNDGELVLTIRASGREIVISRDNDFCPVAALEHWLRRAEITAGPLFIALDRGHSGSRLSGQAIAQIVKRSVRRAGFDPMLYAGHSLRSGLASSRSTKFERFVQIERRRQAITLTHPTERNAPKAVDREYIAAHEILRPSATDQMLSGITRIQSSLADLRLSIAALERTAATNQKTIEQVDADRENFYKRIAGLERLLGKLEQPKWPSPSRGRPEGRE